LARSATKAARTIRPSSRLWARWPASPAHSRRPSATWPNGCQPTSHGSRCPVRNTPPASSSAHRWD